MTNQINKKENRSFKSCGFFYNYPFNFISNKHAGAL